MGVLQIGIRARVIPEFLKWVCYNFKDLAIDDEEFQEKLTETSPREGQHADKTKAHTIPKGIANLENLFDLKE
jgi:hypothetical protein